jgi:hypothetical protein
MGGIGWVVAGVAGSGDQNWEFDVWGVRDGAGAGLLLDGRQQREECGAVGMPQPGVPAGGAPLIQTATARERAAATVTVPEFPPRARAWCDRSAEHEARGLLNAMGLLTRCLAAVPATADERLGWQREICESHERLERLYAAGLDRNFRSAERRRD